MKPVSAGTLLNADDDFPTDAGLWWRIQTNDGRVLTRVMTSGATVVSETNREQQKLRRLEVLEVVAGEVPRPIGVTLYDLADPDAILVAGVDDPSDRKAPTAAPGRQVEIPRKLRQGLG